jgi:iron(III) transport system ATP-binding protein
MISVENLTKTYAGSATAILRRVSFQVARGEIYTLLGPSGCGKTTSLRSIAGLETPDGGTIRLDDRTVFSTEQRINLPPERRDIGMVFQSYAIWPHMTVAENVAYPLRARKVPSAELRRRVSDALEIVGLLELADRPSPNLSGGQQQRIAVARAIVGEPKLLLLDEPLSNLDAKLRNQMRTDLGNLQKRLGHTMVYVTHDQEEALALSDRIALMRGGEIIEEGTPRTMYCSPKHPFTAGFLGGANFVPCRINGAADALEAETAFGVFRGVARKGEGGNPLLFFRPHAAKLITKAEPGALNTGSAEITSVSFLGDFVDIVAKKQDQSVHIRDSGETAPNVGDEIKFAIDPNQIVVFT